MAEIELSLRHPELQILSDGTFRRLLKELSTRIRAIQGEDFQYLVENLDLKSSQQQSLSDRSKPQLEVLPAYYVSELSRGSLEIVVLLAASAAFVLKQTLGETLKEAWKESAAHRRLVKLLNSEERNERLVRKVEDVFGEGERLERFRVSEVKVVKARRVVSRVEVLLETPDEVLARMRLDQIDESFVIEQIEQRVRQLAKTSKSE